MPSTGKLLFGVGALLVWVYIKRRQGRRGRKNLPLPPSPPRDPLIGHVRSIPVNDQDIYFYELGRKYGGIVHLDVLGQDLILLNKTKPAADLLEKRGAIFSGRVDSPMADILGISRFLVFMNYGEEWRVHRRIAQRYLTKEKVQAAYNQELWQTAAKSMVINLLKKQDRWQDCFIHYATSFIIEYAYGHRITDEGDYYVELASNFCKEVMPLVRPPNGALVDIFPFAKHLPSWIPGNGLVGLAREANKHVVKFEDYPIRETTDRIAQGKAAPSFLVTHLEALQAGTVEKGITLDDIKSLAAVLFVGGADTTSSTLSVFLAAMVLHPEYQTKAQEEIERVIGSDRLPDFSDRASLPLVECIMQETLRWQPAVTFGVPHVSTEEDVYDGMYIPKNSLVIPFLRGMAYDPEVYQNPTKFDPERFLSAPQGRNEPYFEAAFGFGRRVCVGRHLADDVVWIAIATVLASLTISKPVDEDGKEYLPKIEFDQGPTCHTHPFPCRIRPRNANMKELISHLTPDLGLM